MIYDKVLRENGQVEGRGREKLEGAARQIGGLFRLDVKLQERYINRE